MNGLIGEVNRLGQAVEVARKGESRGRFHSAAVYHNANQSIPNSTDTVVQLNSEYHDYGDMHSTPAAGTGTVTKTVGGTTLVGVGTLFISEFRVGDLILVGTEYNVITEIADDLNLTVNLAWAVAAAGATLYKSGNGLVIPAAGVYQFGASIAWATDGTGLRQIAFMSNRSVRIGSDSRYATGGGANSAVAPARLFARFDIVQLAVRQTSGGGLNLLYEVENSPVFWAARLS